MIEHARMRKAVVDVVVHHAEKSHRGRGIARQRSRVVAHLVDQVFEFPVRNERQ